MAQIINPFTRQVLNVNPKGCNQYSGKECTPGQMEIKVARFNAGIREDKEPSDEQHRELARILGELIHSKSEGYAQDVNEQEIYDHLKQIPGVELGPSKGKIKFGSLKHKLISGSALPDEDIDIEKPSVHFKGKLLVRGLARGR